ncbi:MAG: ABC transporter substrate-binding protein [Firmicutes bacterium]|nr:ABC transporter substrate-binding protein [Bacillota bacterium]
MKKRAFVLAAILVGTMLATAACGSKSEGKFAGQTLHIYNWGEYVGEHTLSDFEARTGAHVMMDEFESNEQMYIKVATGDAYDILVPSDYMIERLLLEDRLQPLDKSKLTCFEGMEPGVIGLPYDPDNTYCAPYFWGSVGIVYDKNKVDIKDLEEQGFGIFLNEKYKGDIYLYDSERDSFMMALKYLGYSMNTDDPDELNEAYEFLLQCVNTMQPEIVTDEIIDNMAQGRKALGLIYSGDATYVMAENEDMGYFCPETGTNLWSDCMVIPKNAENVELAHEFINFISEYDPAYDKSEYVGYTSPIAKVNEDLSGEGGEFEGIDAFIPRTGNPNDEVFNYNEETRKVIAELWSKVKIAASNAG